MVSMFLFPAGCIGFAPTPDRLAARDPCPAQEVAHSIVAINRDDNVSVPLVGQNSRMALCNSNRAYAFTNGQVTITGLSAVLFEGERIMAAYLEGNV